MFSRLHAALTVVYLITPAQSPASLCAATLGLIVQQATSMINRGQPQNTCEPSERADFQDLIEPAFWERENADDRVVQLFAIY